MKKVSLIFDGESLEQSVDAFELANTIIAFGRVLESIYRESFEDKKRNLKIEINAFKEGSFVTDLVIDIVENKDLIGIAGTMLKTLVNNTEGGNIVENQLAKIPR